MVCMLCLLAIVADESLVLHFPRVRLWLRVGWTTGGLYLNLVYFRRRYLPKYEICRCSFDVSDCKIPCGSCHLALVS